MPEIHESIERKFIESYEIDDYEILTDIGFKPITHLHKTVPYIVWRLETKSHMLLCADDHLVFDETHQECFVKNLIPEQSKIITQSGIELVKTITPLDYFENMFDLSVDSEDRRYYTDGILSHNTTTAAIFLLWYACFNEDKLIYILANKASLAREILGRVCAAYERLPFFLQPGAKSWNKGSIELGNNSRIITAATTSSAIRGSTANLVYLDEFAFVEQAEEFFKSTYPTISSGKTAKMIISSTPQGLNLFYKLWKDAKDGVSDFTPFEITWDKVPGRDEAWKQKNIALLGDHGFRQEYGNEFLGSSNTLISGDVLQRLTWEIPIRVSDDGCWKFLQEPKEYHRYIVAVDSARGQEADSSVMVVIDYTAIPYHVVAMYKSDKVRPIVLPTLVVEMARKYNEAYLLIERNSIGQTVVEQCWYELEYENIFGTTTKNNRSGRGGQKLTIGFGKHIKQGVEMTATIKKIGTSMLKTLIEENKLDNLTDDIVQELYNFISLGNSWGADKGKHDDLVMALVLFSWTVSQSFFKEFAELDIVSSILNNDDEDATDQLPSPFFSTFANPDKKIDQNDNSWLF